MKLDQDCVRQLLLAMEEHLGVKDEVFLPRFHESYLSEYSFDEVLYTSIRLHEANLIEAKPIKFEGFIQDFALKGITYEGHEFLQNIRDPKIWKKTKKSVSKLSSVSLKVLLSVAEKLVLKDLDL